jgi:hypothetical protein
LLSGLDLRQGGIVKVIIGVHPHKRSVTIEVIDQQARVLATGTYNMDNDGYGWVLRAGRVFPAWTASCPAGKADTPLILN